MQQNYNNGNIGCEWCGATKTIGHCSVCGLPTGMTNFRYPPSENPTNSFDENEFYEDGEMFEYDAQ